MDVERMNGGERFPATTRKETAMKSAVAHAIKTNHFPEATRILSICWRRCFKGLPGIHFTDASYHEQCMMRGWSVNHEGLFSFTSTHDLCDASFSKNGLEAMVRQWYRWELERRIEEDKEFNRKHPYMAAIPCAGKALSEYTLDEWIFDFCR